MGGSVSPKLRLLVTLFLLSACSRVSEPNLNKPEKVFAFDQPTWYEDAQAGFVVSPDGHFAIYTASGWPRWIDLSSGTVDTDRLKGGLDTIRAAVIQPDSSILRRGSLDGQQGWFLAGEPPRMSEIPPDALLPQWSEKQEQVAYRIGGKLLVGTPKNAIPVQGLDDVTSFRWSPDFRHVYAISTNIETGLIRLNRIDATNKRVETLANELDGFPSLIAIDNAGNKAYLSVVSSAPLPRPEVRHDPSAHRNVGIYELDLKSGQLRAKTTQPDRDEFAPVISGRYLYWTRNVIDNAIVVFPITGGDARIVVDGGFEPHWNQDGTQIGFAFGGWRLADWALNLDGAAVEVDKDGHKISEPRPMIVGYHEDFPPIWSPDGKWIAYHSHRSSAPVGTYSSTGSADDIFIRKTDAPMNQEVRLTDFGWEVGSPDWSPDGRHLVFSSWEKNGTPGIYSAWVLTIDPATGKTTHTERLKLPPTIRSADDVAWSPLGDELAVEDRIAADRHAIWVVKADGSKAEKVTEYPMRTHGGVAWTPDGKSLVYAAIDANRMQLFTISRQGGSPRKLTNDQFNIFRPRVSRDGRWIAATRQLTRKELWRIKL
jgi:WD40 repeat protein